MTCDLLSLDLAVVSFCPVVKSKPLSGVAPSGEMEGVQRSVCMFLPEAAVVMEICLEICLAIHSLGIATFLLELRQFQINPFTSRQSVGRMWS